MENKNIKKFKTLKILIFLAIIALLLILTIKLLPLFKNLATDEGRLNFKSQMADSGNSSAFIIIGLQLLQILVPILPGEPIEFLAGMCYGSFNGMIILFIGSFLSSFIIFFCVRKFGINFIETFLGHDTIEKIYKNKLLSNPKRLEIVLFFVFLIPGTPKDLFVYLGGLLPVHPIKFLLIATFARFPSIISSTIAGANTLNGNFKVTIFIYVFTLLISCFGIIIYNIISKPEEQTK